MADRRDPGQGLRGSVRRAVGGALDATVGRVGDAVGEVALDVTGTTAQQVIEELEPYLIEEAIPRIIDGITPYLAESVVPEVPEGVQEQGQVRQGLHCPGHVEEYEVQHAKGRNERGGFRVVLRCGPHELINDVQTNDDAPANLG